MPLISIGNITIDTNPVKKFANHGVSWESGFGYNQAVQVKDTIYLSGQLSHDSKGNFIAPAELDESGRPIDYSQMEQQIRQTYANAKKLLAEFGATLLAFPLWLSLFNLSKSRFVR